jgi:hypothetical protein
VGFFDVSIEGLQIKLQLAQIFGLEFVDFEFKGDEALEFAVVEEEVDEKVAVADLEAIFLAEEAEVAAQFEDEVFEATDEGGLKIVFGVAGGLERSGVWRRRGGYARKCRC